MKEKVTNTNCGNSLNDKQLLKKQSREKIKVHHSLMEFYTDTGLIDEYDIEVDYSNEEKNSTYGVTKEDLDEPNFWQEL
ncbi:hypothetical protein Sta7437_4519 (plasmid) [Stanieria cyanosphaera PCC 7437]|uniref:Uncharacterized protein n=1 Tax=Stanieria cyanosphaera (strain ATCC 29371 / PCC 7437) TaxID=111780 RepID=K9Y0R6_STAC7|nr:hypothetical protein [Stanieria cyanosphaera]AFZ37981.1 hypothetical protein Sta7437_4519 [Stanieria cyanosphaera PCC 7437]